MNRGSKDELTSCGYCLRGNRVCFSCGRKPEQQPPGELHLTSPSGAICSVCVRAALQTIEERKRPRHDAEVAAQGGRHA